MNSSHRDPRTQLNLLGTHFGMTDEELVDHVDRLIRDGKDPYWTRRNFLTAFSGVMLLGAGCSSAEKHRGREGDNTGQTTSMTVDDEKKMAQEIMPEIQKEYPRLNQPQLQNYISDLGNKIVKANGLAGNPYQYNFSVVDVGYVNAFALPAGTVMVTAPLMEMAETEAELAGVVGHEIGHIKARHTAERMDAAKRAQKKSLFYGIGGAILGGAAGFALGKALCKPDDKECRMKAIAAGGAVGGGAGFLVAKFPFMANSREDEMEADRIGFRTSVAAGFDKDHVGTFYAKLLKMEQERKQGGSVPGLSAITDALSTHPPSQERVNQMNQMAGSETKKSNAIVSRGSFTEAKKIIAKLPKKKT